jgi:hypothetical protein
MYCRSRWCIWISVWLGVAGQGIRFGFGCCVSRARIVSMSSQGSASQTMGSPLWKVGEGVVGGTVRPKLVLYVDRSRARASRRCCCSNAISCSSCCNRCCSKEAFRANLVNGSGLAIFIKRGRHCQCALLTAAGQPANEWLVVSV